MTAVLVTGAAGDIGAAIAARLASAGSDVTLADHPEAAAQLAEAAERCRSRGGAVATTTFDVTDERSTDDAIRTLGEIGGLVNSAGLQGAFAPIDSYPIDDARKVFDVNVLGVFAVLSAVSRRMVASGRGGSIVNVASMAGVSGAPNMPAYSASKAAVIGLTKAAAKDLAPSGIRVNSVSPAFIGPGRMWEAQTAQQAAAGSQYYASDPGVVAFLLSEEASYVTGVNLEVSGGSA